MASEDKSLSGGRVNNGLGTALARLWVKLTRRRKVQLGFLVGLSILASSLEVLSLGLLFPFLALLAAPLQESRHPIIETLMSFLGTEDMSVLAGVVLIGFCLAALVAGVVRLLVLVSNNRFSFSLANEIGEEVYRRSLFQPYTDHLLQNSSTLVDAALNKTMAVAGNIVAQVLLLITSALVGAGILAAIMMTDAVVAISTGLAFGGIYAAIILLARGELRRNGETIARQSTRAIRALQEGLGGIRDVIIDGSQDLYVRVFREADRPFKMAMARNAVIAGAPRFVVETLGMILIASLAFVLSRGSGGVADAIPTLGVLALGAQRLLPMLQQSYAAFATIRGNEAALWEVLRLLDRPLPTVSTAAQPISFQREISLEGVRYGYPSSGQPVILGLDLKIRRGERVGFFGPTGGGKSTTLDIIMGLLSPTSGALLVDGILVDSSNQTSWRSHLAHVPQSIFLSDGTVAENIAFGAEPGDIDRLRVREAARLAQIDSTIESWPAGYDTIVGERGVRLSGGQRQRIGVARALYKHADLIILDEATSALDNETESALIAAIGSLGADVTVLMVAHRLTTLRNCDLVVELEAGKVKRLGAYADLIGH